VWIESREERDRRFPDLRGMEAGTIAMCAVPLVVGDRTIGALRFSFDTRKLFDEDERNFVLALAAQTAITLQRTELYAAERQASLELQRALLPGELVPVPGWDVAAHYSPAGDQEAGGDFYDLIPISGGRMVAVVGDVMGRGVQAAAAMAQIRSTIRAYALDDPEPDSVFRRVDAYFEALNRSQLVTVLYLLVDAAHGVVRVANAGHLQPLCVDADGARLVAGDGGLPFGVQPDERGFIDVDLQPGAALVVITDGLVERRGEDLDEGISRVLEIAASAGPGSAAAMLTTVMRGMTAKGLPHDDDVTVLVLRRQ
ncbi:MAG TPA: GAF domain-containing SpoIIE family protein phosphatase, partial [Mycobacteriales bacterium]|nr:GAF domain-containing SpoIIE family protein phosphatase [Mycobacteriales bacterium]